jgi:CHAD domain-containing protein
VRVDPQLRVEPDADIIREAHVSVRRLRSHMRTFAPIFDPAWAEDLREQLQWLNDILSGTRDTDVVVAQVLKRSKTLRPGDRRQLEHVLQPLRLERSAAYEVLSRALRTPQYVDLIDALIKAAKAPRFSGRAWRPARKLMATFMQPAWRRLRKRVRAAGLHPRDRELDQIRAEAKHLRYAADALIPVASGSARRFAKRVDRLQSQLGKLHDTAKTGRALRHQSETSLRAFVVGELVALEATAGKRWRDAWPSSWQRVARKKSLRFWR